MAAAGVASRRVSEDLIAAGRVTVNGKVVTEAGRRIDPDEGQGRRRRRGRPARRHAPLRHAEQAGRRRQHAERRERSPRPARSSPSEYEERLFNVGRLDVETSGLLILTNDGELAHVLAHPSFGVTKTYIAKVRGVVTPAVHQRSSRAASSSTTAPSRPTRPRVVAGGARPVALDRLVAVEITLHSGRNRIVRRMLEAVGHPVIDLVRRSFGPLHLGTLKVGHMRVADQGRARRDPHDRARRHGATDGSTPRRSTESADAPVDEADVVELALGRRRGREGLLRRGRRRVRPRDRRPCRAPPRGGPGPGRKATSRREREVRREQEARAQGNATRADPRRVPGQPARRTLRRRAPRARVPGKQRRRHAATRGASGSRGYRGSDERPARAGLPGSRRPW